MLKTGLTAFIGVIILQAGVQAQVYVKNTGNVGIGVTNPSAKLELPDAGSATLRVGISSNMSNSYSQLLNSLTVIGQNASTVTHNGAVAYNFFNNGNNPSWSGTLLYHYGNDNSLAGNYSASIEVDKRNLGVLHFQNESNGLIVSSGNIYLSPGYGKPITLLSNGNVGIGTTTPAHKFHVIGNIKADVMYATAYNYADYVFDSTYQLPTLKQVETFIKQNHHLPEVPSETEVKKDGIDLGAHQVVLLKKVEELTLYAIEQDKKQQEQNEKLQLLEKKMAELMEANNKLQEELVNIKSKKKRAK